jgi:glycerol-3-phosphate dehydrogenase subunit C
MTEGSLEAPIRHPLDWRNPEFYDDAALDAELRRVFDICHGCRRCFNLCDSFPRLFDLIDESATGELDSVRSEDFKPVVDACTLCDMCFMTKCPYVPPHEFNLDFPHLMLRYRAAEKRKGHVSFVEKQVSQTDRNGRLAAPVAGLANWATREGNALTRPAMEAVAGIDRKAALPKFHGKTFTARTRAQKPGVDTAAPAYGRKAVLYATCFVNYNNPGIGEASLHVLAKNGVETEVVYPRCCGMPKLEHGDLEAVAANARAVAAEMKPWIEKGYDIIALVPSCALMLKFEWPLIVPDDEDVKLLSGATRDISEYIVDIAKKEGLAEGMKPLDGGVTLHLACHARAQNMGPKAAEMLRLIPGTRVGVIERCSGHGGSWGIMKENFETALKVGKPAARQALEKLPAHVVSECPLAGAHIVQGMERIAAESNTEPQAGSGNGVAAMPETAPHPVELIARAYGFRTA